MFPKSPMVRRLFRFAVVGGTVMVSFMALNKLFSFWVSETAAFLLAYVPAVALHYWLNKKWTFGCARTDVLRQFSEYAIMVGITFVVQAGFFWLFHHRLGWAGWISAGGANAAQMVLTFLIMQRRVFAPRTTGA